MTVAPRTPRAKALRERSKREYPDLYVRIKAKMDENERALVDMMEEVTHRLLESAEFSEAGPRLDVVRQLATFMMGTMAGPNEYSSVTVFTMSEEEAFQNGFKGTTVSVLDIMYDLLCHANLVPALYAALGKEREREREHT